MDPFESTNLAQTEPKQLRHMMQKLITAMEQHNALYPVDAEGGLTPLEPMLP
jgi:hypothetical protein